MIVYFSDLNPTEREYLSAEARKFAALSDQDGATVQAGRWREITEAVETGGKQPHGVEPGVWQVVGDKPNPHPFRLASAYLSAVKDAGTGGPC
jgi:hypothetical protein